MKSQNFLWPIIKKHKWLIFGLLIISLFESAIFLLIPYFSKLQIDELQKTNGTLAAFIAFLAVPFLIQALSQILINPISSRLSTSLRDKTQFNLQKLIYQKIASLDNSFFDNNSNRRLINIAQSASNSISGLIIQSQSIFSSSLNIFAVLPILLLVDYRLLLLTLFSTVVQAVITQARQKAEARYAVFRDKKRDDLYPLEWILGSDYGNFRVTGDPAPMLIRLNKAKQENLDLILQNERQNFMFTNFSWLTAEPIDNLTRIIVAAGVLAKKFTLGDYTMINTYLGRLSGAFRSIINNLRFVEESRLSIFQLNYFLNIDTKLKFTPPLTTKFTIGKSLILKNIYFTYPVFKDQEKDYIKQMIKRTESFINKHWSWRRNDLEFWQKYLAESEKTKEVLHGLNLEIKPGRITALLGRNGAGKTTITNLALHGLEPDQGLISYGSLPLPTIEYQTWLNQFSVVKQNPYIAHRFSLWENLTFGVKKPSEKQIWNMLAKLGLSDHIRTLPKKLESLLGEDTNLSGGQNQLLAICRALLQNRPFFILDEALSQLDIEKETAVMDLLRAQAKSSGILFITHRITTARKADYIYILDQGRIVEEGTHDQLIAKDGLYSHFWHLQTIA